MPAQAADLHTGDVVLTVNGKSTLDIAPAEVWDWFGNARHTGDCEVSRDNQPFEVTLRRMDIGHIPDFTTRATFLTIYQHNGRSHQIEIRSKLLTFFLRRYMYRTEEEGYAGPNRYVEN